MHYPFQVGLHGDRTLYTKHIEPLVYAVSLILPIAYIIGLWFTMKTHSAHVFEEFEQQLKEENAANGRDICFSDAALMTVLCFVISKLLL